MHRPSKNGPSCSTMRVDSGAARIRFFLFLAGKRRLRLQVTCDCRFADRQAPAARQIGLAGLASSTTIRAPEHRRDQPAASAFSINARPAIPAVPALAPQPRTTTSTRSTSTGDRTWKARPASAVAAPEPGPAPPPGSLLLATGEAPPRDSGGVWRAISGKGRTPPRTPRTARSLSGMSYARRRRRVSSTAKLQYTSGCLVPRRQRKAAHDGLSRGTKSRRDRAR